MIIITKNSNINLNRWTDKAVSLSVTLDLNNQQKYCNIDSRMQYNTVEYSRIQ